MHPSGSHPPRNDFYGSIPPIARSAISEVVQVPPELTSFASEPQFQQILLKVKEQSNINTISIDRNNSDRSVKIIIDSPTSESALLARKLIEIHFKQQLRVREAEARLQKVQMDLFTAQGEMASGLMVEFTVNKDLLGLIIGKKGAHIKMVEKQCGCTGINVDGDTGTPCCELITRLCLFLKFLYFCFYSSPRSHSSHGARLVLSAEGQGAAGANRALLHPDPSTGGMVQSRFF